MRRFILASGLLCLTPVMGCDNATNTDDACAETADCLDSQPQTLPPKAPPVELTGADARYVHATIAVDAPFAMTDWCVNVSLVSKANIEATGLFCRSQFEAGDEALLANLKCDPSHHQTLVVTVEDVDHAGGDWNDNCGALGCFASVQCSDAINMIDLAIAVGATR